MRGLPWTASDDEVLRSDFRGTALSSEAIAHKLSRTLQAVKSRAYKLGLARQMHQRWTEGDDERLYGLMGRYPLARVAKLLNRSVDSVSIRARKLGAGCRAKDGWYTLTEVCQILGVHSTWLRRRIDSKQLKASYHHGGTPQVKGLASWHIREAALRKFIVRYPQDLMGRNVDLVQVVAMLAGIAYSVEDWDDVHRAERRIER